MEKINNGGPAFPQISEMGDIAYTTNGMTLRDYFAAKAMAAILERVVEVDGSMTAHAVDAATEGAYFIADAMLRAREA